MDDLTGRRIKGYELRERLGAGGFGAVYRAEQPQVGREAAVKIILPQYANHPDFIRRFEVEARVIARLEHPHIIPLYDYWRDAEGAYLVMRYLRGGSLRSIIKDKPLTLEEASRMLDQLAAALAVAHRHGVIHRDIKPDNILLDEEGNPYLTDFGIAKELENDSGVTQADMVIGSPAYLSPEQVKGEEVLPQSDIYSMGIVLYEILSGEHPFSNERVTALLMKHLNDPLPPLNLHRPDIPDSIEQVIQRATAKDPRDRYTDMLSLAAAFRQAILVEREGHSTPTHMNAINRTLLLEEVDIENPYKGLQAFEEVDAANFFGREALVDHLLARLREQQDGEHFLAVIGPSGSGKSSLVQAGLIPRMRNDTLPGSSRWFIVEMLPGSRPLEELEAALLRIAVNPPPSLLAQLKEDERGLVRATKRILNDNKSEIFLFIDQFEEVFTRARDKDEVEHFLNSLVTATTDPECRLRVIITLRADFYDKPLLYPAFGNLVRQSSEVVLPMSPEELERAIVGPAERVGTVLEPGLVQQIIADLSKEPGALPLLQYALTELFERRSGRVLTLEAYHSIGGALGALARQAEEQYTRLIPAQRELARQLFLRLVTPGESGTDDTRRRILHTAATSIDPAMEEVIAAFDRSRLLTFDHDPLTREPTIEVAHEALIREWQQLKQWLTESREDLLTQRRLGAAAADWLNAHRDPSYLLTGARLEQFESWQLETRLALSQEENDYLRESIAEREIRQAQEAEREKYQRSLEERSRNRLRMLVGVMAAAALVAVGLASIAIVNGNQAELSASLAATAQANAEINALEAERSAAEAERSAAEARSLALDANARNLLSQHDPSLALALAIESHQAYQPPSAETQQTLALAAYGPSARYRMDGHEGSVLDVATNGVYGLSAGADGRLLVWDLPVGAIRTGFDLEGGIAHSADLTADGTRAVTGMFDGSIILWSVPGGEVIRRFEGHSGIVSDVHFSPDETQILSGGHDRTVRLWDMESGEALQIIETPGAILRVAFSPDGLYAASSSADRTAGPNHPIEERDRMIRVWDLESGEEIQQFAPNSGFVRAIDYSPDGRYILSGTWNSAQGGTMQLWNIETGDSEPVRRFYGVATDIVSDVHFSSDGTRILSASWDGSVRLWDASTGIELQHFAGFGDRILTVDFTPNEEHIMIGLGNIGNNIPDPTHDLAADSSTWLWDLRSRAEIHRLQGHTDWIWGVDISPDGLTVATGSGPISLAPGGGSDTTVRLWDMGSGAEIRRLEGHTDTVSGIDFSPDGWWLLSASWDRTVRQWDVTSGQGWVAFEGHDDRVLSVAYSADGTQALSASRDRTIRLWDVATGEEIQRFEGHESDVTSAVFSPDGTQVASASLDRTVRLWDVTSGDEIRQFEGHSDRVNAVVFSPDGQFLLSTSWDTSVRLWDVATGREIRQFVGHSRPVFGAAFSPDGRPALTGSSDLSVRLWDVASGDEIRRFEGHTNWVLSVVYSPDGTRIVTGAEDNTARIWEMARNLEELLLWARENRYIPDLTCPQRAQYRVEPFCDTPAED